jgi:hypothetical protein
MNEYIQRVPSIQTGNDDLKLIWGRLQESLSSQTKMINLTAEDVIWHTFICDRSDQRAYRF